MRLYLGGKMIGLPEFGFGLFDYAAGELRALGHHVFNPADHDRTQGFDPTGLDGTWNNDTNQGLDRKQLLMDDLTWIWRYSEGMVALSNWIDSPGARFEVAAHQALYLPVWLLDDFLKYDGPKAPKLLPVRNGGRDWHSFFIARDGEA